MCSCIHDLDLMSTSLSCLMNGDAATRAAAEKVMESLQFGLAISIKAIKGLMSSLPGSITPAVQDWLFRQSRAMALAKAH